jgi:hypothetical protein
MFPFEERHEREQYFFTAAAARELAGVLGAFERPCCLCASSIGVELHRAGVAAQVLDLDTRFAFLPGLQEWDLYRPKPPAESFGAILCDPPFFNISLSQLFRAIRVLARFDHATPVAISYLRRRSDAILATFASFGLRPTGYRPAYETVQRINRNQIEFFANFASPLWPAWEPTLQEETQPC